MNVTQTRQKRIKELKAYVETKSDDPEIVKGIVISEAQRKYGVSPKTAREYAKTILYQLDLYTGWYATLDKKEVLDERSTEET